MARFGVQAILPQFAAGNLRWLPTRYGVPIVAVVIHRMEGTLYGTDQWFRYYRESGVTSTHFGVGFMSEADRMAGRSQVRQWVDTAHTAFGWNARPSDVPTDLAKKVFTPVGLYDPTMDMNRSVIAIETEGYHTQPWNPYVTRDVKRLLAWIGQTHGPLWVVAHTDLAAKPCPGLDTFHAALPGVHGSRLTGSGTLPDTALPTPPYATTLGGALPMSLLVPFPPKIVAIPAGVKLRAGPRFGAKVVRTTTQRNPWTLIGWTPGDEYRRPDGDMSRRWSVVRMRRGSTDDSFDGVTVYFPRTLGDERDA